MFIREIELEADRVRYQFPYALRIHGASLNEIWRPTDYRIQSDIGLDESGYDMFAVRLKLERVSRILSSYESIEYVKCGEKDSLDIKLVQPIKPLDLMNFRTAFGQTFCLDVRTS